CMEGTHRRTF
nr:immunoglobulin light chain junction region [Macaca mulatta]MOW08961.1 immunoglobulin light chain junction region [Macaca mulatta]MOW11321.1 immunoglobulin light chain junction region [Macaca mulatta]MOW12096.1 immunoglobulin light chain junction region [Macaca mulatta]MOW12358.1 immunoglobulin light chain junction region [Macaca mulatta]